jgi:hypothetical protein
MRLRQLFENIYETVPEGGEEHDGGLKTIGICYGRWNPPHKGHKNVWQHAAQNPIWFVGTNENTGGSDIKNPLPYDVKLQVMAAVWPEVAGHVIPVQDLFVMCNDIYEQYGENIHLKIYTDEQWLYNGLVKNNGIRNPKHGFYKFHQIDNVPMKRLASATDLRANALSGNKKAFYHDMGVNPATTIEIEGQEYPVFEVVAHYLNAHQKVAEGKGHMKPIDPEYKAGLQNAMTMPAMNQSTGSAYLGWRLGIALAGAPDYPTKMAADNWIGGDPLLSTYTEEEMDMVKKAMDKVGGGTIQNWSGKRSQELPGIYKTSPVAKIKKNKYGI